MITEFRIGASHTFNLGNFESLRIEAAVTIAVPEGEDFAVLRMSAQKQLHQLLEDTYKNQRRKSQAGEVAPNG